MLDGFEKTIAQFCQCEFALRSIDLSLLIFEARELALCQLPIGRFQAAADLLAAALDTGIINAVR